MKVKIEIVEGLEEEEAVIRCRELNDFCISLQSYLSKQNNNKLANLDYIYSITRNLTASSMVEFTGSRKKTMVSRSYYKLLLERLNARKLGR